MTKSESRTRTAAALVLGGLLTEWITLRWAHPTAFLVFVGLGGLLLAGGTLLFLSTLLRPDGA